MATCAVYEEPPGRLEDDHAASGASGAGSNVAGSVAVAGLGGAAGSAGSGPSPSGGAASGEGGMGGSSSAGESGSGGAGAAGEGGAPDPGGNACPECVALQAALVHRYDFEGTGTAVMDRVGTAHGSLVGGATLSGAAGMGVVSLNGGTSGAYVNLPNGLVSSLTNASIEVWVSWAGGAPWQRIFDFGDSTEASPEDNPGIGRSYLFVTPMTGETPGGVRAVYSIDGGASTAETRVEASGSLPLRLAQLVLVVNAASSQLLLYQDGEQVGAQAFDGALGSINDVNCWLGRSQYEADPELAGVFHDFRVYGAALTAAQIAASFAGGPDPAFLAE